MFHIIVKAGLCFIGFLGTGQGVEHSTQLRRMTPWVLLQLWASLALIMFGAFL